MAKTLVVEPEDSQTKTPFLRGILTRSLQEAGLSFAEAYSLASAVREELSDTAEITTGDLRGTVLKHLSTFSPTIIQHYQNPTTVPWAVVVRNSSGHSSQFSRERYRRILESSGLTYEESTKVSSTMFGHLIERNITEIHSRHLGLLTYRYLRAVVGVDAAHRYLALVDHLRGNRPLVLLIGGAPGTGKSAVASEIAHRLDIARNQSTDLLREVMRMMLPERLVPVLHRSSYDAWKAQADRESLDDNDDSLIVDGYRNQAELLSVPCEAVIKRSLREQTSIVLEGVHVQRSLLETIPKDAQATVILVMLSVLGTAQLRERFRGRGQLIDMRRAERYLQHFDEIWRLQSYLLSEADRGQIPIIVNNSREQVIRDIMNVVTDALIERLDATASEVFA